MERAVQTESVAGITAAARRTEAANHLGPAGRQIKAGTMRHPKDRSGLTRRQLLRGAAGAAAGIGAAGALAACQNTTTPIGFCEDGTRRRQRRRSRRRERGARVELVVPKPVGPGGLPLPRTDNSVTWAITDDNPPIADGVQLEGGTLRLFNYADYIDPGLLKRFREQFDRKVEIGTYNSSDEAIAKLSSGEVDFDVLVGLSGSVIVQLMAKQLLQPLNHSYLPNLEANVWPSSRTRSTTAARATPSRTSSGRTGSAGATTRSTWTSRRWTSPGTSSGSREDWRGKVGLLDDKRDALSMPMQRDAMARGYVADVNTEDPEIIAKAGQDLQQLDGLWNIKVTITDYQTLPEGKSWLHHSWSGDLLAALLYYLPDGNAARGALLLGARERAASSRTTSCASHAPPTGPPSRTRSSTSCSTRRTPTTTS